MSVFGCPARLAPCAVLAACAITLPLPALAVPYVYADAILGVKSVEGCVQRATMLANKHGFTSEHEVVDKSDFYAAHADMPMTLNVSCSSKIGTIVIAVAGMNNQETFAAFQKIYADF